MAHAVQHSPIPCPLHTVGAVKQVRVLGPEVAHAIHSSSRNGLHCLVVAVEQRGLVCDTPTSRPSYAIGWVKESASGGAPRGTGQEIGAPTQAQTMLDMFCGLGRTGCLARARDLARHSPID